MNTLTWLKKADHDHDPDGLDGKRGCRTAGGSRGVGPRLKSKKEAGVRVRVPSRLIN